MDNKNISQQKVEGLDKSPLKSRLIWAIQPVFLIFVIFFWVLNPQVVDQPNLFLAILGGFLLGALAAFFGKYQDLRKFLDFDKSNTKNTDVYRKNRLPEEFYWGHKDKILFSRSK